MATLGDLAFRAAGIRPRQRLESKAPPRGALANPTFNGLPHQPLWPEYEGPHSVALARRNVWAAKCIDRIAGDVAALPFFAGNMDSRMPRPTSAMQQLLGPAPGGPNPMWSAAKLWKHAVRQWLIVGKFAWLHEYDQSGRIVALWPLMSQYLVPVIAPVGGRTYFEKFRYGTQGSPGYREFTPDQLTYVWNPADHDFRLPQTPLQLARYGIKISSLLEQFDDAWLSNGGVPAHLVVTPPFANDGIRTSFRDQFRRKFGGPKNANRPMFAEVTETAGDVASAGGASGHSGAVRVETIAQSAKDAQLDVMRDARIVDMCAAFGVPISLLGASQASKFTNMGNDRANYYQGTVRDTLTDLQDGVNIALGALLDGPRDLGWFDTSGVPELRPAPRFDQTTGLAAVAGGVISPNDWREECGLPRDTTDPDMDVARIRTGAKLPAAGDSSTPTLEGGQDAPPVDASTPVRAAAVREDLFGVVREQLGVELRAMEAEIRARLDGKRGGRKRAHAQLDLGNAYDLDHWRERGVRNLSPALDAAGMDASAVLTDITSAVFEELSGLGPDDAWESVFDLDGLIAVLRPGAPALLLTGAAA